MISVVSPGGRSRRRRHQNQLPANCSERGFSPVEPHSQKAAATPLHANGRFPPQRAKTLATTNSMPTRLPTQSGNAKAALRFQLREANVSTPQKQRYATFAAAIVSPPQVPATANGTRHRPAKLTPTPVPPPDLKAYLDRANWRSPKDKKNFSMTVKTAAISRYSVPCLAATKVQDRTRPSPSTR